MKINPLDRQSVIDVALQTSGSVEAAFALSAKNEISISEAIVTNKDLETVDVVDKLVLYRYVAQSIKPATAISEHDATLVPSGGIGYMGVDIDFRIE